ncbi:MAG: GFA family protein [Bdellovibrionales bacterium]|nr:GFA family protein [Bdellovibrionales bacterium]
MKTISGSCLCEKVQYTISSSPLSQGICYCQQCQRASGSLGSPMMVLPKSSFSCSTELAFYETTSARGSTVKRYFCKDCGSHVYAEISDAPEIVTVKVATLSDLSIFTPQYLVWTENMGAKHTLLAGVPAFEQNAPLEMVLGLKTTEL